jgi:hypothetical protein
MHTCACACACACTCKRSARPCATSLQRVLSVMHTVRSATMDGTPLTSVAVHARWLRPAHARGAAHPTVLRPSSNAPCSCSRPTHETVSKRIPHTHNAACLPPCHGDRTRRVPASITLAHNNAFATQAAMTATPSPMPPEITSWRQCTKQHPREWCKHTWQRRRDGKEPGCVRTGVQVQKARHAGRRSQKLSRCLWGPAGGGGGEGQPTGPSSPAFKVCVCVLGGGGAVARDKAGQAAGQRHAGVGPIPGRQEHSPAAAAGKCTATQPASARARVCALATHPVVPTAVAVLVVTVMVMVVALHR